ncbi:MAG: 3-oxoacyl-[acyl-carrier-protein] synthase [Gaiellaceae bacterium]|nr:3-oxoacyl-[acyl-carrier-protein] synthase [Gaiellaceae bacterium]
MSDSNGRRRVVITGMGAVTPLGNDAEESWQNLIAGKSGAGPITLFDPAEYPTKIACELKGFDPEEWIDRKAARKMDRFAQMVLAAARQAETDSGLDVAAEAERIGSSIATGIGGLGAFQDCYSTLVERGPERVGPFSIPAIIPNMGAAWVSMSLGTRGPLTSQCTACAASNMAIGEALDAIRLDRADVMFAGGTEAGITRVGIAGFGAMRALSRRNDDPEGASRPFDAGRDGFVMGEAGAVLVLEELEHAKARGAKIYAELLGYGVSSDALHITEPDPTGENPARAMRMAMTDAGVAPEDIGYINAHGTSTPVGDASETRVIKLALGEEHARKTPVSSTKGATGHCLGAAGAVEAIFTTLALRDGILPPTINQDVADPDCDLDYIPNEARKADIRFAASNSFGFGGHNACIVLARA